MSRLVLIGVIILAGAGACRSPEATPPTATSDAASTTTTGASSASSGSSSSGAQQDPEPFLDDIPRGGPPRCSSDLREIVDAEGSPVQRCAPDLGCSGARCIDACDAAASVGGTLGCTFVVAPPPFHENDELDSPYAGPCHAIALANAWDRPARVTLQVGDADTEIAPYARLPRGRGVQTEYLELPDGNIPPGEVALVFVSHRPGVRSVTDASLECPIAPAIEEDLAVHGSGIGATLQLSSDTPVTAFQFLPFGGAASFLPSASLLFPVSAWGDNYVVTSPHPDRTETAGLSWLVVAAAENDTEVRFAPRSVALPDVPARPLQEGRLTLDAGEFVQFAVSTAGLAPAQWQSAPIDFGGTILESDRRIGVFAGNTFLPVVTSATGEGGGPRDAAHQQLAPVQTQGFEYVAAGHASRIAGNVPEPVLYRVTGLVDGTELDYVPQAPPGAPSTLEAGDSIEFEAAAPFVVRALGQDTPFSLTQYMGGQIRVGDGGLAVSTTRLGCAGTDVCWLGDSDWIYVVPISQFAERYVFAADPTYGTTTITLVRRVDEPAEIRIDCREIPADAWEPIATGGFEVAHIDLFRARSFTPDACAKSLYEVRGDRPFALTVWGLDRDASVGFPAGLSLVPIHDLVIPAR